MITRVATPQIALVGNPNCGKSTLFNALTGARAKVVNAPGTTVDLQLGVWHSSGVGSDIGLGDVEVVDLPGTYSLLARSPDERVTTEFLSGQAQLERPHRRSEPAGCRCGSAVGGGRCTCHHRADVAVVVLDATALARSLYLLAQVRDLGIPVVAAVSMLDVASTRGVEPDLTALADAAQVPAVAIDPRTGTGIEGLSSAIERALDTGDLPDVAYPPLGAIAQLPWDGLAEANFAWTERVLAAALPSEPAVPVRSWSDRVDQVLLHRIWGIPVFLGVLWVLFQLATAVANPLMDVVSRFVEGPVTGWLRAVIPPGWVQSLLVDGVLTGVGTVLAFAPLLALIFLGLGLLEDSGYLARAAFVADRFLRGLGLDGRAMIPLVLGFGCNLPAVSATRTMPDARRRLLTGLLIPFTTCPARLVVYVLVAGIFFPHNVGTVVFGMYLLSAALVVLGGLVLRATLFRDLAARRPLVLALPAYHVPRLKFLVTTTLARIWAFIKGAGGIIAGTLVVVWLLTAIPLPGASARVGSPVTFGAVPISESLYARGAGAIAPVLAPAGLDDWRIASSLVTGFVAKEVMVGALAQGFAVTDNFTEIDETRPPDWLATQLHSTLDYTSGGHPRAAALAFMVFVLSYTPCVATVAEQKRVFGWRWAFGGMAGQLIVAWLLAVGTFQLLRLVW